MGSAKKAAARGSHDAHTNRNHCVSVSPHRSQNLAGDGNCFVQRLLVDDGNSVPAQNLALQLSQFSFKPREAFIAQCKY